MERQESTQTLTMICRNCLSDISFTPPLEAAKSEAANSGHMNKGAKILFKLRENEKGWFAMSNGDGDSEFCFGFSDHNGTSSAKPDGTYCIGFGYNGFLTDKKDASNIIDQFKKDLRPGVEVQAYLTHDWMNDPLAKGVWSCWGPYAMSKYLQSLQEPQGRVIFASADWADGWRGFVDGAVEQGQRAAQEARRLFSQGQSAGLPKL